MCLPLFGQSKGIVLQVPHFLPLSFNVCFSFSYHPCFSSRPEPHARGGGSQAGQADSPLPEQDEEILGSDDDEQEDPNDYCRGMTFIIRAEILF